MITQPATQVKASNVTFADGQTFQQKLDNGSLKGQKGDTGSPGANGKDGVSPTVKVSKSGTVTTVTITDASGAHTATINDGANGANGKDGAAGAKGADGFSPTVATSKSGSVTTVTITDASGAHKFDIKDGTNGTNGSTGPTGPAGPNTVSTTTGTNITGLLKGNGSTVAQAVANTDYLPVDGPVFSGTLKSKTNANGSTQTVISGMDTPGVAPKVCGRSGAITSNPNYMVGFGWTYTGREDVIQAKQGDITGTSFTDVNIRGIATPAVDSDAANKKYVDDATKHAFSTSMGRATAVGYKPTYYLVSLEIASGSALVGRVSTICASSGSVMNGCVSAVEPTSGTWVFGNIEINVATGTVQLRYMSNVNNIGLGECVMWNLSS